MMPGLRTNYPAERVGKPADYEEVKNRAFHKEGIVIAALTDPRLDSFERQFLKNIGSKLFGGVISASPV